METPFDEDDITGSSTTLTIGPRMNDIWKTLPNELLEQVLLQSWIEPIQPVQLPISAPLEVNAAWACVNRHYHHLSHRAFQTGNEFVYRHQDEDFAYHYFCPCCRNQGPQPRVMAVCYMGHNVAKGMAKFQIEMLTGDLGRLRPPMFLNHLILVFREQVFADMHQFYQFRCALKGLYVTSTLTVMGLDVHLVYWLRSLASDMKMNLRPVRYNLLMRNADGLPQPFYATYKRAKVATESVEGLNGEMAIADPYMRIKTYKSFFEDDRYADLDV